VGRASVDVEVDDHHHRGGEGCDRHDCVCCASNEDTAVHFIYSPLGLIAVCAEFESPWFIVAIPWYCDDPEATQRR